MSRAARNRRRKLRLMKLFCGDEGAAHPLALPRKAAGRCLAAAWLLPAPHRPPPQPEEGAEESPRQSPGHTCGHQPTSRVKLATAHGLLHGGPQTHGDRGFRKQPRARRSLDATCGWASGTDRLLWDTAGRRCRCWAGLLVP